MLSLPHTIFIKATLVLEEWGKGSQRGQKYKPTKAS
jgi:hypothetical protein